MEPCDAFKALLQTVIELDKMVRFMFDANGLPTVVYSREMGAITHPPGSTMDFVFPNGTSKETARTMIEKIWLTDEEKDAYNDDRNTVLPFWVVADDEERGGAPNMSGRFKLNADFRALDGGNIAGVVGLQGAGGEHEHVLVVDELPIHEHDLTVPSAIPPASSTNGLGAVFVPEDQGGVGTDADNFDEFPEVNLAQPAGADKPHNNMPPFYTVIVAYRTDRMS